MNITVIRPPAYANIMGVHRVPYIGMLYIAASAREAGHKVDVIDMCGEDIDRAEVINDYNNKLIAYGLPFRALKGRLKPSRVIGFSCMFSQDWVFNRDLIRYVRGLFPESILVAGGEHISAIPEYCLNDSPELDVCVIGEGEESFVHFLSVIESGNSWSEVPSIVYRDEKGKGFVRTPRAERIKDINSIPWPAWELIPLENYLSREMHYLIHDGRTMPLYASRGCPYKCTFCSNKHMWQNLYCFRDPKETVNEIEFYVNRYSVNNLVFNDLTIGVNKKQLIALCNEIIKRKLNITWQAPGIHAGALDYDILKFMYQAGCTELHFAFESGSKKVLDMVNKTHKPAEMISLIRGGLAAGINITINIIVGLPGEGYREFFHTYLLAMKGALIGLYEINVFPLLPYPGSALFYKYDREGKIKLNDEYFFGMFSYINPAHTVSFTEKFSPKMLNLLRIFILASFYFLMFLSHPKRVVQLIINTIRGISTTKFEVVIKRVMKNARVYFSSKSERM